MTPLVGTQAKRPHPRVAAMKAAARLPDSVWSGRPTAQEIERRKRKVIAVAADSFLKLGFAETTIRGIAKTSRVTVRTINHHFTSKEALFREAILARVSEASVLPVFDGKSNLTDFLRALACDCQEKALHSCSIEVVRLLIAESARLPEMIGEIGIAMNSRFQIDLAARFRALAEFGLIPGGDHDRSAQLFTDLLLGNRAMMFYAGWTGGPAVEADIAAKVDLFIRGRFGARFAEASASPRVP